MRAHLLHGPWLPACLNCEQEIPLKRLKAYPYAERCLACQKLREEEGRIDDEPSIPDSVLATSDGEWEGTRNSRSYRYQRRIAGVVFSEVA